MADLDDTIARYQAVVEDLRAQIPIAHQALRDLKHEQRELIRKREAFTSADDLVKELDLKVATGIKSYEEGMLDAIAEAQQRVYRRFDQIMLILLGEDPESVRQGKTTVVQLVRELVQSRNLPVKITEIVHLEMSPETKAKQKEQGIDALFKRLRMRGMDELPIITDSRVPADHVWIVIPPVEESDRRTVYDLDTGTKSGHEAAMQALEALMDYRRRKYAYDKAELAKVPAAFRRKEKAGPA